MSVPMAIILGILIGAVLSFLWCYLANIRQLKAEFAHAIRELEQQHREQLEAACKRSVNTSRAVLKGKMAEQFAPLFPEFNYMPSDAKFLGDPIDYVVFHGYSAYREGLIDADALEVVFIDIKSGQARLSKAQQAIAQCITAGQVRFETIKIELDRP
jgi:predicted Holliday junction resolvase-like endonuclease